MKAGPGPPASGALPGWPGVTRPPGLYPAVQTRRTPSRRVLAWRAPHADRSIAVFVAPAHYRPHAPSSGGRGYLEFNPCDTVSRPAHDKSNKKPAPRPEQISRLLRQIESEAWGSAVVITVAAGLRKGEVLALGWEDIEWTVEDFPGFGEVNIARQIQRVGRVGLLVREIPKTAASDATRPLPPMALAALERRRREQKTEMLRAPKIEAGGAPTEDDHFHWRGEDVRPGKTGFIFTTDIGTPIDPRNFDRWFQSSARKPGCQRSTPSTACTTTTHRSCSNRKWHRRDPGDGAPRSVQHHGQYLSARRHRRYVRCGSGRTGLPRKGAWQLSALPRDGDSWGWSALPAAGRSWKHTDDQKTMLDIRGCSI